jgi:hypothetical protein
MIVLFLHSLRAPASSTRALHWGTAAGATPAPGPLAFPSRSAQPRAALPEPAGRAAPPVAPGATTASRSWAATGGRGPSTARGGQVLTSAVCCQPDFLVTKNLHSVVSAMPCSRDDDAVRGAVLGDAGERALRPVAPAVSGAGLHFCGAMAALLIVFSACSYRVPKPIFGFSRPFIRRHAPSLK